MKDIKRISASKPLEWGHDFKLTANIRQNDDNASVNLAWSGNDIDELKAYAADDLEIFKHEAVTTTVIYSLHSKDGNGWKQSDGWAEVH